MVRIWGMVFGLLMIMSEWSATGCSTISPLRSRCFHAWTLQKHSQLQRFLAAAAKKITGSDSFHGKWLVFYHGKWWCLPWKIVVFHELIRCKVVNQTQSCRKQLRNKLKKIHSGKQCRYKSNHVFSVSWNVVINLHKKTLGNPPWPSHGHWKSLKKMAV